MATSEITRLLNEYGRGDRTALDRAMPLLYDELHRIAVAHIRRENAGHTLNATSLLHEAYLRLAGLKELEWEGRRHFLSMAARVMRRVLVDHARRRGAAKRGDGPVPVTLDEQLASGADGGERVLEVHDALERLASNHSRAAQAVELRFFGGLTVPELADALDISVATAERDLRFARAWLTRALAEAGDDG
jgi:RNA polymerase sigma-70 factor, ECF subfamily